MISKIRSADHALPNPRVSISPTRLYVWILGTLVDIWGGYLLLDAALSHDQIKQPPGEGKGKKGENKGGK